MTNPRRLFVLGSFVVACCARVARLPLPGESLRALGFTAEPGGKGLNVAIAARKLGAEVDCLLAVGDDLFGATAEPALRASGLGTDLVRRYPMPTGAGIGFIQDGGENSIAVFPGANEALSPHDVSAAGDRVGAASMVLAQFEVPDAPILEAFTLARKRGRATLLNPSPFRSIAASLLMNTTILVVNETEARALALSLDSAPWSMKENPRSEVLLDLARLVHSRGVEILIVTLGAAGAVAYPLGGEPVWQPGYVVEAVDVTGAGDAFIAAFAARYGDDRSLRAALDSGARGGAVTASRAGTFSSFPSREELEGCLQLGIYDLDHIRLAKDTIMSPKTNP
jgi:ribokinase